MGTEPTSSMETIPPPSTMPERTLLAPKPQFPLKYQVENAGPGGVARVQLWVTQDGGRTWFPQPEDTDKQSPYSVDLKGDGTFGLWLVVQGVSGLGDTPPTPGTRPTCWWRSIAWPPCWRSTRLASAPGRMPAR